MQSLCIGEACCGQVLIKYLELAGQQGAHRQLCWAIPTEMQHCSDHLLPGFPLQKTQSSLVSEVGEGVKSDWVCVGSGLWGLKTPNSTLCPGWPCSGNLVGRADTNSKMPSYLWALLIGPQLKKKFYPPHYF